MGKKGLCFPYEDVEREEAILKKQILAVLIISVMALGLTGCKDAAENGQQAGSKGDSPSRM